LVKRRFKGRESRKTVAVRNYRQPLLEVMAAGGQESALWLVWAKLRKLGGLKMVILVYETKEVDRVIRDLGIAKKVYEDFLWGAKNSEAISKPCPGVSFDNVRFYITCYGGRDFGKDSIWIKMYYWTKESSSKPYIWFYLREICDHGKTSLTAAQIQALTELMKKQPYSDKEQRLFTFAHNELCP